MAGFDVCMVSGVIPDDALEEAGVVTTEERVVRTCANTREERVTEGMEGTILISDGLIGTTEDRVTARVSFKASFAESVKLNAVVSTTKVV